ncbi:CvpA family protein [Nitratifractor sp.]
MPLNLFDLVVVILVLFLGFKGAFVGVRRELFAFLGLIGGVLIASRGALPLAGWVEAYGFHLGNPATLRLVVFILILMLVWGSFSWLGRLQEARSRRAAPSPVSRLGGFLLAAGKYFLVFSMILSALYPTPAIRHKMQRHTEGSILFTPMMHVGKFLLNRSYSSPRSSGKKSSNTKA